MANLTTTEWRELVVKDEADNVLPILPNSVQVTGDASSLAWSPLYGNGQLDVSAVQPGTATVTVTLGAKTGTLEIVMVVEEGEPGTLVITLGPSRPK